MARHDVAQRSTLILLLAACVACSSRNAPAEGPRASLTEAELAKPLPRPLPEIAARVNGQPISSRNVALATVQLTPGAVEEDEQPSLMRQTLQKLIVRELLFQEAAARKLAPDERALERAYNEARVAFKEDAAWRSFLEKQGNDERTFRTELRVQYTIRALLDREAAALPAVSDEQARSFYDANPQLFDPGERLRASHIQFLISQSMPPGRKAELRTRLEAILLRGRRGEDFAKLARQYSEHAGSKAQGGELPPFARGQLPRPLEDAAFALNPGQISDVVETPTGLHIIRLHERLPAQRPAFEQIQAQVKEHVARQARERRMEQLVAALRAKARIETYF